MRILARGEHEGLPFLVLQFLRGGSLGDRIRGARGAPIPSEEIRPWRRELCRAPPAPPTPAPQAAGTTVTVPGTSRRTIWMVLTLLCLGVPLAWVASRDDGGPRDLGASTAEQVPGRDDDAGRAPSDGVETGLPAWARELVATWGIDRRALERRLKGLGPSGKRPPRLLPGAQEIERMLRSDLTPHLGEDGRFTLRLRALRRAGPEHVEGTWRAADQVLLFNPSAPPADGDRKDVATTFLGRPAKGGLMLDDLGMRVLLKKQ